MEVKIPRDVIVEKQVEKVYEKIVDVPEIKRVKKSIVVDKIIEK